MKNWLLRPFHSVEVQSGFHTCPVLSAVITVTLTPVTAALNQISQLGWIFSALRGSWLLAGMFRVGCRHTSDLILLSGCHTALSVPQVRAKEMRKASAFVYQFSNIGFFLLGKSSRKYETLGLLYRQSFCFFWLADGGAMAYVNGQK